MGKNWLFYSIREVTRIELKLNLRQLRFLKGLFTPANGFVTEEKRIKHAEFGYPVTKFISSDARDSSDRFVERLSHIMTVHQTGVSIRFIRWKVLNMFKT